MYLGAHCGIVMYDSRTALVLRHIAMPAVPRHVLAAVRFTLLHSVIRNEAGKFRRQYPEESQYQCAAPHTRSIHPGHYSRREGPGVDWPPIAGLCLLAASSRGAALLGTTFRRAAGTITKIVYCDYWQFE